MKKKEMDLLNGSILKSILLFALPLAASSILQQLFNSADVAIVGRFAGNTALAAVGSNGSIINLLVNMFTGISVGANVVIAAFIGQKNKERINLAIHTSLFISIVCSFVLMFIGVTFSRTILQMVSAPEDIIDLANVYLKIYFCGMPFIMGYNFLAAIYRSKGDTKTPLYVLTIAGIINVGLNLIFVVIFHMSVAGVALATVIANVVSSMTLLFKLTRQTDEFKVTIRNIRPHGDTVKRIVRIGLPSGLQSTMYSLANVVVQASVNALGSTAVAASSAAMNYEYISYFILAAFGQAAVTFMGQNYAAGKLERCRKLTRDILIVGCALTFGACMLFIGFRAFFVSIFTTDAAVAAYAYERMKLILSFQVLNGVIEIISGCMRGVGYASLPAALCVVGICGTRVLYIRLIYPMFPTFRNLMMVYPISCTLTAVTLCLVFFCLIQRKVYRNK